MIVADIERFIDRANQVRARNKVLESVPGSGFHDNDRDAHNRLCAPHTRHLPGGCAEGQQPIGRISNNIVAFIDDRGRKMRFFGEDARIVKNLVEEYIAKLADRSPLTYTGTERKLADEAFHIIVNPETGELEIWMDTWNDFLHIFDTSGVGVSSLPIKEQGNA